MFCRPWQLWSVSQHQCPWWNCLRYKRQSWFVWLLLKNEHARLMQICAVLWSCGFFALFSPFFQYFAHVHIYGKLLLFCFIHEWKHVTQPLKSTVSSSTCWKYYIKLSSSLIEFNVFGLSVFPRQAKCHIEAWFAYSWYNLYSEALFNAFWIVFHTTECLTEEAMQVIWKINVYHNVSKMLYLSLKQMNSELLLLFYQRSYQHSNEIYFYNN